jgi:hypothetical protein
MQAKAVEVAVSSAGSSSGAGRGLAPLFGDIASAIGELLVYVGAAGLLLSGLLLLASLGVLWRKRWGRILTLVLAALTTLWTLINLDIIAAVAGAPGGLALVAAQLLYVVLAVRTLIKCCAEFAGVRAEPGAAPDRQA